MSNQNQGGIPEPPSVLPANVTTALRIILPGILPLLVQMGVIENGLIPTATEVIIGLVAIGWGFYKNHKVANHITLAAMRSPSAPRPNVPL